MGAQRLGASLASQRMTMATSSPVSTVISKLKWSRPSAFGEDPERQCSKKHEHWARYAEGTNNAVIPRQEQEVEATGEAGVKLLES